MTSFGNHLDHLAKTIRENGGLDVPWLQLVNGHGFRGEYWDDDVKAWAHDQGFSVSFNSDQESCTFRADQST